MSKSTNALGFFAVLAAAPFVVCSGLMAVGSGLDSTYEPVQVKQDSQPTVTQRANRHADKRWTRLTDDQEGLVCVTAANKLFLDNGVTPDEAGLRELGLGCAICLNTAGKEADFLPASDAAYLCATSYLTEKAK